MVFFASTADTSLFLLHSSAVTIYLLVYVDDITVVSSSTTATDLLIEGLRSQFAVKDLGRLHYFLGVKVTHHSQGSTLTQQKYVGDLLRHADMTKCKPSFTPMSASNNLSSLDGDPLDTDASIE